MFEIVKLESGVSYVVRNGVKCCLADDAHLALWEEIIELRSQLSISEMISADLGDRIKQLSMDYQEGLGDK